MAVMAGGVMLWPGIPVRLRRVSRRLADAGRSATGRREESMQAEITVRRVRAEEWERLRAIRLCALADTPMAFGSTLAAEQAQPDEFWRGRAAGGAADDDRATFIAERDGAWVGIATCVLEDE